MWLQGPLSLPWGSRRVVEGSVLIPHQRVGKDKVGMKGPLASWSLDEVRRGGYRRKTKVLALVRPLA